MVPALVRVAQVAQAALWLVPVRERKSEILGLQTHLPQLAALPAPQAALPMTAWTSQVLVLVRSPLTQEARSARCPPSSFSPPQPAPLLPRASRQESPTGKSQVSVL